MLIRKDLPTNQPEYFEWTLVERDIAFIIIFFASFALICQQSPLKKKALDTEKPEKRKIGIFAGRWGKETDIGEGMGESYVSGKKIHYMHYKNIRYFTVNLYITRKSFTRIEKEKSIWKQEVSQRLSSA